MVKPILTVPHEILRTKSKDVVWDKKTEEIVQNLSATLFAKTNPKGVGLSAPQIGKNWNVFVTWLSTDLEAEPTPADLSVFINPRVTEHSQETTYGPDPDDPILEGCLSIPSLYGQVPRWTWVEVEFERPQATGHRIQQRFSDFEARVMQHEYDHLQGKLFTDYSLQYDLPVFELVGKKMEEIDKDILKAF